MGSHVIPIPFLYISQLHFFWAGSVFNRISFQGCKVVMEVLLHILVKSLPAWKRIPFPLQSQHQSRYMSLVLMGHMVVLESMTALRNVVLIWPSLSQWHLLSAGADGKVNTYGPTVTRVALKKYWVLLPKGGYWMAKTGKCPPQYLMISRLF